MIDEQIKNQGWERRRLSFSSEADFERQLMEIAAALGQPVPSRKNAPLCQKLRPLQSTSGQSKSLSKQFSTGEFPLHSDTAYWTVPCRYIVLGCLDGGEEPCPTEFLHFNDLEFSEKEMSLLRTAPFHVKNGRYSFISTVMSSSRAFMRYDPGCMLAATEDGYEVAELLSKRRWRSKLTSIAWEPGDVAVIDNWKVFHGRGFASNSLSRTLLRASVK